MVDAIALLSILVGLVMICAEVVLWAHVVQRRPGARCPRCGGKGGKRSAAGAVIRCRSCRSDYFPQLAA